MTLKYGYYGNRHLVLGPSSSRLLEASSVFVKQIQVRDEYEKGVSLYGFSEKPELSLEKNWSVSTYVIVASYGRKVISLEFFSKMIFALLFFITCTSCSCLYFCSVQEKE